MIPELVTVHTSLLTDLGDAVRERFGVSGEMTIEEMTEIVKPLPSGYTRVEYLESNGTQYIDTGAIANLKTTFYCDCQFTNSSTNQTMGYNSYPNSYTFGIADKKMSVIWGSMGDWTRVQTTADTQRHLWGLAPLSSEIVFDDTVFSVVRGNGFTSGTLYLFATRNPNQSGGVFLFCSCKVFTVQIYNGIEKIRDFIPCIRNSDSVAGMYDIINDQFYTNAGTGTFITP